MVILDAEFQHDREKLTIYYNSEHRIDFRELVRDLFSIYKARIWMKKVTTLSPFQPTEFATIALMTGIIPDHN